MFPFINPFNTTPNTSPVCKPAIPIAAPLPKPPAYRATMKINFEGGKSLSYIVIPQPPNDNGFVSSIDRTVTQFQMPYKRSNTLGFLAHNYIAGRDFSSVSIGDRLEYIGLKNDNRNATVKQIIDCSKLDQKGTKFSCPSISKKPLTEAQLYNYIYKPSNRFVLQTCIGKDKDMEWGRKFIIGE